MYTHVTMRGCFVQSVKNAQWSMSPQKAGDGLESIVEFQVQIKTHNQREYEDKWQGWQNWTDDPLLLLEREVHAEIGMNWFLDQEIPKGGYVRILAESLLWGERLGKTRIGTTEGLTTCMEPHREWIIASSSWKG